MNYGNQPPMMYGLQPQSFYQPAYQMPMQNPYAMQMQLNQQQMQQIQQAQQPQQMAVQPGVIAKIVKNRKEMEEEQIGFGNDLHVFVNIQGDELYTKRFNPDTGEDQVRCYKNVGMPDKEETPQEIRDKLMTQMEKRFKALEEEIAELKAAGGRRRRAEEDA